MASSGKGRDSALALQKLRIRSWVRFLGLPDAYATLFIDEGFDDLSIMSELTVEDMRDLGIVKRGHVKKVLRFVRNFKTEMGRFLEFEEKQPAGGVSEGLHDRKRGKRADVADSCIQHFPARESDSDFEDEDELVDAGPSGKAHTSASSPSASSSPPAASKASPSKLPGRRTARSLIPSELASSPVCRRLFYFVKNCISLLEAGLCRKFLEECFHPVDLLALAHLNISVGDTSDMFSDGQTNIPKSQVLFLLREFLLRAPMWISREYVVRYAFAVVERPQAKETHPSDYGFRRGQRRPQQPTKQSSSEEEESEESSEEEPLVEENVILKGMFQDCYGGTHAAVFEYRPDFRGLIPDDADVPWKRQQQQQLRQQKKKKAPVVAIRLGSISTHEASSASASPTQSQSQSQTPSPTVLSEDIIDELAALEQVGEEEEEEEEEGESVATTDRDRDREDPSSTKLKLIPPPVVVAVATSSTSASASSSGIPLQLHFRYLEEYVTDAKKKKKKKGGEGESDGQWYLCNFHV